MLHRCIPTVGQQRIHKNSRAGSLPPQPRQHIIYNTYVQARIAGIQSVLMAEAAAAARVAKQLSLSSVNFLTDNQSMPNFYNSRDLFNPPHWNIKT